MEDLGRLWFMKESPKTISIPVAEMIEEEKTPPNKSPLYRKMTIVMHVVIFLYAAAFWIQTGVLPVSFDS